MCIVNPIATIVGAVACAIATFIAGGYGAKLLAIVLVDGAAAIGGHLRPGHGFWRWDLVFVIGGVTAEVLYVLLGLLVRMCMRRAKRSAYALLFQ
jgi:hypothetical protein